MPFALLIVGAFLLIAAVRGQTDGPNGLFALVAGDFTGSPNYTFWIVAILLIGSIGYIQRVKPVSDAMLVLVILVLFLSKGNPAAVGGGFFTQFTNALNTTTTATPNNVTNQTAAAASSALAPGQSGTQSVIQAGIQNLQSSTAVSGAVTAPSPLVAPLATGAAAVGGLVNQLDTFGSDFGGWVN